jgi:hypothetical protein
MSKKIKVKKKKKISAISWRPVLVVEEAGVPGENHRPWASKLVNFITCGCYVSLHYVLPALQFICACLIFMNMYVLLVSVCKCIVCFYVIFITAPHK